MPRVLRGLSAPPIVFVLAALSVALGVPGYAAATPATRNGPAYWPRVTAAVLIGAHTWGPSPCGTPIIKYEPLPYNVGASANPVTCAITVSQYQRRWYSEHPAQRCTMIVHEVGHLAGHPHSLNLLDVMYGGSSKRVWKRCVRDAQHDLLAQREMLMMRADRSALIPAWQAVLAAIGSGA